MVAGLADSRQSRRILKVPGAAGLATLGVRALAAFPTPQFESDYTFPMEQRPGLPAGFWDWLDLGLLVGALGVAAYLVHRRRSRRGLVALALFCFVWFGLVKDGCVCAVGSVQNVAAALGTGAWVPFGVVAFFTLPLVAALLWGRVFCAGVCPLGAVQEILLTRPVKVPAALGTVLGFLPFVYLGLALVFAANQMGFIICEYDPFVRIFRGSGTWPMVTFAVAIGLLSLVVGRPYCRWLCPYGVLLGLAGMASHRAVRIPNGDCVNCHLCRNSCPYDAIRVAEPQLAPADEKRTARRERTIILVALLLAPLLAWGGAVVGGAAAPALFMRHPAVAMHAHAAAASAGEKALADGTPVDEDVVAGFGRFRMPLEKLGAEAVAARERIVFSMELLGGLLTLILVLYVVLALRRRRDPVYSAGRWHCLACARCFPDCPVTEPERVMHA